MRIPQLRTMRNEPIFEAEIVDGAFEENRTRFQKAIYKDGIVKNNKQENEQ